MHIADYVIWIQIKDLQDPRLSLKTSKSTEDSVLNTFLGAQVRQPLPNQEASLLP